MSANSVTPWSVIGMVAEKRIEDAIREGMFDDIPGQGKPLEFEDTSHIAPELRMAYKILHNAGCLPPELEERKEINRLVDLLDSCEDEQQKIRQIQKIRFLLQRSKLRFKRSIVLEENDPYYARVLAQLDKYETSNKNY